MEEDKSMENRKHLLPIDMLLTMSRRNTVGEYPTAEHATNAFNTACIHSSIMVGVRQVDNRNRRPGGQEVYPPINVLLR